MPAPPRRLHLVGNAHLDPVWLWEWPEGFDAVRATFRAQLDLLREHPGYVFTCSSSCCYEWVERCDPAMFEEVRAAVAQGRIVPVGGWYIQPEGNTGTGESFARLGLYGQRYFLSRFGKTCGGGYLPDTFGQNGNLPALLRGAELRYHVFKRPPDWGLPLPQALFLWRGVNGDAVPTYRIAGYSYGGFTAGAGADTAAGGDDPAPIRRHIDRCLATISDAMPAGMLFYGVGNHGGGPTRAVLRELETYGRRHAASRGFELVFSDPETYFRDAAPVFDSLPEHRGSIQKISIGCYSNWNRVKRAIRHAEVALVEAEMLQSAAALVAGEAHRPSPPRYEALWKRVLFVLFHDMATGTSIAPVEEDALRRLTAVRAETDELSQLAAATLARTLDTRPPATLRDAGHVQAIVLVQPLAGEHALPVELELMGLPAAFRVIDAAGAELPHQELPPRANAFNEAHGRHRFLLELPGERPAAEVLFVVPAEAPPAAGSVTRGIAAGDSDASTLRCGDLELRWDAGRGITALHLRGDELLVNDDPLALNILDDDSDSWGHSKRTLTQLILHYDLFRGRLAHYRTELIERGPVRQTLRSAYRGECADVELLASLVAGLEGLVLQARIDWRGRYQMLKLSLHTTVEAPLLGRAKIPFCHERVETDGRELPAQEWVHLSGRRSPFSSGSGGESMGLALISDTTYSYSMRGSILDATLLRSTPYAYDFNTPPGDPRPEAFTDRGRHVFRFLLLPDDARGFEPRRLDRLAVSFLRPPRVVREYEHAGTQADRALSCLRCDADNVAVAACKRTEDDDGYGVRLVEMAGRETRATVTLRGRAAAITLSPLAIRTLVFRDNGRAEETSFLERSAEP